MGQVQGSPVGYPDPRMGLEVEGHILPKRDELYGARLVGPFVHSVVVVGRVCAQVREGMHVFIVLTQN